MKKTIALILALVLLFALSACGKSENKTDPIQDTADAAAQAAAQSGTNAPAQAEENAAEAQTPEQAPEQAPASTVNFDEVNNSIGARLSAPTIVTPENEDLRILEENGAQIAQYTFQAGGVPCGIRFSPDFTADISGVTDETGASPFTGSADEVVNVPGAILGHWVTVDGQYVLIMADENPENFNALLEDYKALTVK